MSALSVMIPLAHYSFGIQKLAGQRDVVTFLLDRNAEQSHSEKVPQPTPFLKFLFAVLPLVFFLLSLILSKNETDN